MKYWPRAVLSPLFDKLLLLKGYVGCLACFGRLDDLHIGRLGAWFRLRSDDGGVSDVWRYGCWCSGWLRLAWVLVTGVLDIRDVRRFDLSWRGYVRFNLRV